MRVELGSQASVKQVYLLQCCGDLVSLVVQQFLSSVLLDFEHFSHVGGVTSRIIIFSPRNKHLKSRECSSGYPTLCSLTFSCSFFERLFLLP